MSMKNKKFKKVISVFLSLAMVLLYAQPAFAKSETPSSVPNTNTDYVEVLNEYGLDGDLVGKVMSVSDHIYFNEDNNALRTDLSDKELSAIYSFSNQQVSDFHAILDGTYQPPEPSKTLATTRAARFYLSNQDLTAGVFAVLGTAAAAGPAALMAAWTSVSSALAGPLGSIAGMAVSALGYAFFADLAAKIVGAIAQGKGVAFYLDWGFPPVSAKIE